MEVTLGGDRLGSGQKQTVELHNYQMSSFNQEQDFKSTMAPGVLYPFLKLVGTPNGTFDIDLDHFIRTLPTNGPLFGSFKFQADIFCCPIRLYQGILHNNPVDIGLKMHQVYLPKIQISTEDGKDAPKPKGSDQYNYQISNSSLVKYLGISGIGTNKTAYPTPVTRKFNAVPILAYFDIFKNYYSNKQEENAYQIVPGNIDVKAKGTATLYEKINGQFLPYANNNPIFLNNQDYEIKIVYEDVISPTTSINMYFGDLGQQTINYNIEALQEENYITYILREDIKTIYIGITKNQISNIKDDIGIQPEEQLFIKINSISNNNYEIITSDIKLQAFPLKNIDKIRQKILSINEIGEELVISDTANTIGAEPPLATLTKTVTGKGVTLNAFKSNGLLVKTYQSDLFNNWLNTDTVDLISQMTKIDTTNGFTMDDLNFMEKNYNILNRVAVSGGTFEDWQDAVYGKGAIRKCETPMYMGGMSAEIMFEEVIASTEAGNEDNYQALGALAGKGTTVNKYGGNDIHINCEEPCYIIGICSITPRIAYSQGNDWDMMELDSLDDLHKPGFDGIGFQDLMIDTMAWWNTECQLVTPGQPSNLVRHSAGKQIAWINYQTAVDKIYGEFADSAETGSGFMVLNRNYEREADPDSSERADVCGVKDLTTYIDPAKYNYAFSYTKLDANNFWVQIHSKVVSRRKMAAQQIPNL